MVKRLTNTISMKISNKMLQEIELLTNKKDKSEFIRLALEEKIRAEMRALKRDAKKMDVSFEEVMQQEALDENKPIDIVETEEVKENGC